MESGREINIAGKKSQVKVIALALILTVASSSLVLANFLNETANPTLDLTENRTVETPSLPSKPEEPFVKKIEIKVEYPERITRGENFKIKAFIKSLDQKVRISEVKWELPSGFEILDKNEDCEVVEKDSFCTSEILVSSFSSELGKNEVKIVVSYE